VKGQSLLPVASIASHRLNQSWERLTSSIRRPSLAQCRPQTSTPYSYVVKPVHPEVLLLFRESDEWHSGLCSQVDPDVLLRVPGFFPAKPTPFATPSGFFPTDPPSRTVGVWLVAFLIAAPVTVAGLWLLGRRRPAGKD